MPEKATVPEFATRMFNGYLRQIEDAVFNIHQQKIESVDKRIEMWKGKWTNAVNRQRGVGSATLLQYGKLLGRLAEGYSLHSFAEEILDQLAESALRREPWIPDPASILITAGEFNRRRGDLDRSERRYNDAVAILTRDLFAAGSRKSMIHRELGRLFYEIGYLHRLRGDAKSTRSALERSEAECDLANDQLGAEIARAIMAMISYEEGFEDAAIRALTERLSRFSSLVSDPEIANAGRSMFARRWVINAQVDLGLAYLAKGDHAAARRLIEASVEHQPSIPGLATIKRIEAQLCLAEGKLDLARDAIRNSRVAISQQGDLNSTEGAAATAAITGVIDALSRYRTPALSHFEEACKLPPNLHNRRAQGWAWAGRAILAKEAGDRALCHAGIQKEILPR